MFLNLVLNEILFLGLDEKITPPERSTPVETIS
jgi:hypothetical protein